jgi:peptidoglycan/xylan/chitin deacetylase (PgdA/CDA1 family)
MVDWKHGLLGAYYTGTLPYRLVANGCAARQGKAPLMVLFYHRVADNYPNGWTISSRAFKRQIRWLQARFELISLEETQRRIRSGRNTRPAVSITFDDGYAENFQHALPLLLKHRIACTYFVSTQHVLSGQPFPHDVASGRALRPNTPQQLRAMSDAGIEIAAHTRTHVDLGTVHDPQVLYDEVVGSMQDLQAMLNRRVRYFAFPFGLHANLNSQVFHLARQNGLEAVCSAYGGYNFAGDDDFHLQRIHADRHMIRLKNWLTVDPRKLSAMKRFEYGSEAG